jgi:hypothetical protein
MNPQVAGVAPRSIYAETDIARAWDIATASARGNIRPVPVWANRRIIGVVQGRDVFSDQVRAIPLRQGHKVSERERLVADLVEDQCLDGVKRAHLARDRSTKRQWRAAAIASEADILAAIAAGRYGRQWFSKTPTTNGIANNWYDDWPVTGYPAPGAINGTARTANIFDDTSTGTIYHRGNVSSSVKQILMMQAISSANTGLVMLYDRVVSYDQCTFSTGNQTMTNTNTAARYNAGFPGLLPLCVGGVTVLSATAANLTQFQYTDQSGNATQSMPTTPTVSVIVSAAAPTSTLGARVVAPSTSANTICWGYHLPLAIGDTGVRLIANYTWSAANTGTLTFPLIYPLVKVTITATTTFAEVETVFQMQELEIILDGAAVAMMSYQSAAAGTTVTGNLRFVWN